MEKLSNCKIIGISGKIGSGKTTLSNYLKEQYPNLESRSFAENLRHIVSILINRPVDKLRSTEDKEIMTCMGKTVGVLLQELGTEVVRVIHFDAWILSLFETYNPETSHWIIDDVRFVNEADYIKKMGGFLMRLEGDPGKIRANSTRNLNHSSEIALDNYANFDIIINTEKHINDIRGYFI